MTAKKRFINHDENVIDNINNEQLTSTDEIVTVMNTFHEENQNLKKENELMEKTLVNISGNLTEYRNKWGRHMTEKRFVFVGSGIEDNLENESYLYNKDGFQDVCECLNNLHDENEQLKEENERLCNFNLHMLLEIEQLNDENEQLKKEKDYYKRELQKELVCQAIIDRREKND